MNLNINGHHLEVTPAIRNYVIEKLDRVKRHFDHVIDASVTISVIWVPDVSTPGEFADARVEPPGAW